MTPERTLSLENHDSVLVITFSDPKSKNALSRDLIHSLREEMVNAGKDLAVRAIVVTGAGEVFSSGHHRSELQEADRHTAKELFETSISLMSAIRELEVPVIAAVNGAAIGAGAQLAFACDGIVASESSYFQTQGASKGWFCFTPAVELFPRLPSHVAFEVLFSGAPFTAQRALQFGVVNRITRGESLVADAVDFAKSLSAGDREMIAAGKKFCLSELTSRQSASYSRAAELMAETLMSESAQKRIRPGKS